MVECNADQVDEDTMLEALFLAHESVQGLIALQNQIRAEIGKDKNEPSVDDIDAGLQAEVAGKVESQVREIMSRYADRAERREPLKQLEEALLAEYSARVESAADDEAEINLKHVERAWDNVVKNVVRLRIVNDGVRPDGRGYADMRPLAAEVGLVPRVHGSGMFMRGETQVLTIATLGTPRDSQFMDGLSPRRRQALHAPLQLPAL